MLTTNEIITLNKKFIEAKNEEGLALLITIEQLQKEAFDYRGNVLRKLTSLEEDMNRLVADNTRLISERDSAFVERDTCVGLMVQLAVKSGLNAGVAEGNIVALELKSGQVSWDFEPSEAHLFEGLPVYTKAIEEIDVVEKYRRVMNAEITA